MHIDQKLVEEFKRIKGSHRQALIKTSIRVVLGPSVIRVFHKGTKSRLKATLESINIDDLLKLESQEEYRKWFEEHLSKLADTIAEVNPRNEKPGIYPGYKWGHAAKILNLFVCEVIEFKRYFSEEQATLIRQWLYVPVDSVVIKRLKSLGVKLPFDRINGIDNEAKFYEVQDLLESCANVVGTPRIWFDDNWGDRQGEEE